jgi:hypothetical protein
MKNGRIDDADGVVVKTFQEGPGPFGGHLPTGAGFRRGKRSVNGPLTGFLRSVMGPQIPILVKPTRRQAETEVRKLEIASRRESYRLFVDDANRNRKLDKLVESFIGRRAGGGMDSTSLEGTAPIGGSAIFKAVLKGVASGS